MLGGRAPGHHRVIGMQPVESIITFGAARLSRFHATSAAGAGTSESLGPNGVLYPDAYRVTELRGRDRFG